MKITRILVPLDGSSRAEAVLSQVTALVQRNEGATLVLVRAVDPTTVRGVGFTAAHVTAIDEAAAYLRSAAAQLRREGVGVSGRSVWYAPAGPAIVDIAGSTT